MNIKDKIKQTEKELEDIALKSASIATIATIYLGIYLGITVAVNLSVIGIHAGLEALQNNKKQQIVATLKDKDYKLMPAIHGRLDYGAFQLLNGDQLKVYDDLKVLDGKIFMNTEINRLDEGKTYELSLRGLDKFGYTILDAKEVSE